MSVGNAVEIYHPIKSQKEENTTPKRKIVECCGRKKIKVEYDYTKYMIRRTVHEWYFKNELSPIRMPRIS